MKTIETIDMHTGGEPLRVVMDGIPEINGENVLAKRRYFMEHLDDVRTALMWEPRGHPDMYGAVITGPDSDGAGFGVIFLHNEGYSTMCGHAVIALTKLALEKGWETGSIEPDQVIMDVPAGRIMARGRIEEGKVVESSFLNVPSFVLISDEEIEIEDIGKVNLEVAYGGAFYAFVDASRFGFELVPGEQSALVDLGMKIKRAVAGKFKILHPLHDDLGFLYGTIFTGPVHNPSNHSRNVCVFADGQLDRSATGSGVSARAAVHYSRGEITKGEEITIESILGTTMKVRVREESACGPFPAVIPEVTGSSWYTGQHTFIIDPEDPLSNGFCIR